MILKIIRSITNIILLPLALLWERVYRIRRFGYNFGLFKQNSFRVPIISVGNITFGGTGKTPFTMWLSEYFSFLDSSVLILMRGYKGKLEKRGGILRRGVRIGPNPVEYGDEALLLSKRLDNVAVVVGRDRSKNLAKYFPDEEPDVVILDDGFQHLKLRRNLNIVLFDSSMPMDRYKLAPLGYLREGLSALRDADVIVFGRCDQVDPSQIESLKEMISPYMTPDVVFAHMYYQPTGLFDGRYQKVKEIEELKGQKVICVAGIASPGSFYSLVESFGAEIIDKISFPDHHYFKAEEMERLLKTAEKEDAIIITTEKDMVKIRRIVENDRILYVEIKINFSEGEEQLKERVLSIL